MSNQSNKGLIAAIIFASVAVSGSLVYLGMNMGGTASNALADSYTQEDVQKLVAEALAAEAQPTAPAPAPTEYKVPEITDEDHVRGNKDARYTIVEYSDFDCPYCQRFHDTAKQLVEENENVNWIYRDFPLRSHDPSATNKAVASECVAEVAGNDAFWMYADALMAGTVQNTSESFADAAEKVGADRAAFLECYDNQETLAEVRAEMNAGANAGVSGTPGNFLLDNETGDVQYIPGAVPASRITGLME